MSGTIGWRLRRLLQNQAELFVTELVLLLFPILGVLFSLRVFSIFFVAPVVAVLAAVWSWFEYARDYQHLFVETLARLEDLVEDFGRINFQRSATAEDSRVVKLLDVVNFAPGAEVPNEVPGDKVADIKEAYNTFQLWHLTLRDMVRVMARKGSMLTHDLVDAVNYFIEFYNGFVSNVAEATLTIVSEGELREPEKARETFSIYRENMAHLRGRVNDFFKELVDRGLLISGIEVKPVRLELG